MEGLSLDSSNEREGDPRMRQNNGEALYADIVQASRLAIGGQAELLRDDADEVMRDALSSTESVIVAIQNAMAGHGIPQLTPAQRDAYNAFLVQGLVFLKPRLQKARSEHRDGHWMERAERPTPEAYHAEMRRRRLD